MTGDLQAFAELIEAVRQERPYVLGREVWHVTTRRGLLCRNAKLQSAQCDGTADDITASGIRVCVTCARMREAS